MEEYFWEIDASSIEGKYILLDVDGAICADRSEEVKPEVLDKINELKINNEVVLLSNNRSKGRVQKISEITSVPRLETRHKKPSIKILEDIKPENRNRIMIIGDKLLTDIFFAKRAGIPYIKVKRIQSKNDRLFVRLSHFFDDLVYLIFKGFFQEKE